MLKRIGLFLCVLTALFLAGCGGGGSGGGSAAPTPISGVSYSILWPGRSRATITGPASALSAKIVFVGAGVGGANITSTVDRDTTSAAAYTGTYTLSLPILSNATNVTATFYAAAGETGQVVGTASGTFVINGTSVAPVNFTLTGTVAHVNVVDPGTLSPGSTAIQLQFQALDGASNIVALSPGSAIWSMTTASGASITPSGQFTATAAGTYQVKVTVDGVTSAAATIKVASAGGATVNNGTFTVAWPARSRSPIGGLASALSLTVTFAHGNPLGGDAVVTVDRDASQTAAYTATYPVQQQIARTTTSFSATFFAGAGGSGSAVGVASGTVDATGSDLNLLNIQTFGNIISVVVVDPGALTVSTTPVQLQIQAKDGSNNVIAVSTGSVFWTEVSGEVANAVTADGLLTPSESGTYTVKATVDGVPSLSKDITVNPVKVTAFNMVAAPSYNSTFTADSSIINDNGLLVMSQTDGTTRVTTTWSIGGTLTTIDSAGTALSISNAGLILESRNLNQTLLGTIQQGGSFALLPTGGTAATTAAIPGSISPDGAIVAGADFNDPVLFFADSTTNPIQIPGSALTGANNHMPQMNVHHQLVGSTMYWSGPSSNPATLAAPAGSTSYLAVAISDSGEIVGTFTTGSQNSLLPPHLCMWSSPTAAPVDLGTLPSALATNLFVSGVNSSGTIVGTYFGHNPDQEGGWIYTPSLGLRDISTAVDSSATGYVIETLNSVRNNGWISGRATINDRNVGIILRPNP